MTKNDLILHDGIEQPISEHALDYGIPSSLILDRLARGWSANDAITTPARVVNGKAAPDACPKTRRKSTAPTIEHSGRSMTLQAWADSAGLTYSTLSHRLKRGWDFKRAISTPSAVAPNRLAPLEFDGQNHTLAEWAKITGLKSATLYARLSHGWTLEDALSTPPGSKFSSITFQGRTMNIRQWSKAVGIDYSVLRSRLHIGWSIERALTEPTGTFHLGKQITFNGETMSLTAWSKRLGITVTTLTQRLNSPDWTTEEALTKRRMRRGRAPGVGRDFSKTVRDRCGCSTQECAELEISE